jgi:hypothetical protein
MPRGILCKLNEGAIIVADNMLGPDPNVIDYGLVIRAKAEISSVLVPIGQGLEVAVTALIKQKADIQSVSIAMSDNSNQK